MRRVVSTVLLVALVSLPAWADAPESGSISGTVTDAQGAPMPGVSVTLSGQRGEKFTQTEADGTYRFALLPPGAYKVKAELEGMGQGETSARLNAGGREVADVRLVMSTEETITVTSEAPMVDKFNVTAGTTLQAEIGTQTAGTTRTYYGIINALPGVTADAENDDIQQTRPSVNGTHFADNAVYIDGVDTTFAKFGGSRVFLPTSAVTEVSMEAGGSGAEYGRVIGSSTNVIVKSGTNTYHVDAMIQRQEIDWDGGYKDQPSLARREVTPFPVDWFTRTDFEEEGAGTSFESSFGGPFRRDKAWFFVGWARIDDNYRERLLGGDPVDTSLDSESRIFKVSFQPSPSHSLAASYIDTPAKRVYFNEESFDFWTPTPHDVTGDLATLSWNHSISSSLFLETKLATQTSTEDKELACGSIIPEVCIEQKAQDRGPSGEGPLRFPRDPSQGPFWPGNNYNVYTDDNFVGAWHNGWILSDGFGFNEFPRDQANAGLTQFLGANHELKYGLDYQNTKWEGENFRTGFLSGYNYTSFNKWGYEGAGTIGPDTCGLARAVTPALWPVFGRGRICVWVDYNAPSLQAIKGSGDAEMEDTALYVRDRFTIGDHWTFNVGFRVEDQQGFNDIRRKVIDDQYIDPRFNVTYDVKGDGRLLFSLNAGRYHALLNQAWIAGGGGTAGGMHDKWNGYEGQEVFLFCDPLDVLFVPACGRQVGYNFFFSDIIPGRMWEPIDQGIFEHDIDIYYKSEIILGAEWQFSRNWALDAKYIDWGLRDAMFSNTQIDHLGRNIFLTGNYKNLPAILTALADAREANGLPRAVTQENIDNFQQAENNYRGLQLQANRRFAGGWAIYNNVTWSETDTTGAGAWWNNTNSTYGENFEVTLNQGHLDECTDDQINRTLPVDCQGLLGPFLGQPVSTINRRGPNEVNDRSVIFNSFGFRTWRFGSQDFTLGGHLTFQTGVPWARTEGVSAVNLDGSNASNAGVTLQLHPEGAFGRRSSDEYTLNMTTAWGHPLGGRLRGELRVEAINVTNQQRQRDFNGRGEVSPVRRFFQRPRQMRASYKVRF